ncbi:MAG: protein kinase, partial [Bryobacteraceae bacterium]
KVSDPERKRRFIQEAKAASALNHPNIVTIHDIGKEGGIDFMVMELIPGKTLSELIPPHGQKVEDALKCAAQIADAVAAAHGAGIVHRDLKPGNVMVTPEGRVKVLDFGLAKLVEVSGDGSDEVTKTLRPETEQGAILGTVAYMSPEQAEGKKLDARSDIFSFGVMLYEILTGQRPFQGDTKMSLLAAILRADPKTPTGLVSLPPELERIVMRCLRKDLTRRYQTMGDLRVALEELRDEAQSGKLDAAVVPKAAPPARPWLLPVIAGIAAIAAGGLTYLLTRQPPAKQENWRFRRLTSDSGYTTMPAISQDGKLVAYASDRAGGNLDLYMQQASGGRPLRLTDHPADDVTPSFSPDGTQIVFRSEREGGGVYVVPALGGEARLMVPKGSNPKFSPDGKTIAFQIGGFLMASEIFLVPAAGGKPARLQTNVAWAAEPVWSPDGKKILFAGSESRRDRDAWYTVSIDGGKAHKLRELSGTSFAAAWLADGQLISGRYRAGISRTKILSDGETAGLYSYFTMGSGMDLYPSADSTGNQIAFAGVQVNRDIWSASVEGNAGKVKSQPQRLTEGPADSSYPTVSRDGRSLLYTSDRSGNDDIYLRDLETQKERVLTSYPERARRAELSPDGTKVAYTHGQGGAAVSVISTRGGVPERACEKCSSTVLGWTPDSRQLIVWGGKPIKLFLLSAHDGKQTPLLEHKEWDIHRGQISPDGRWIAFNPKMSRSKSAIYISPMREGKAAGEKDWIAVTDGNGDDSSPMWSPDGNLLYFVTGRNNFQDYWAVRLDAATKRPAGEPFEVLAFHNARRPIITSFGKAVTKDKLFWSMEEYRGNIWIAEKQP